jgi:sporulation protein YlmC with PRC-barrel domain
MEQPTVAPATQVQPIDQELSHVSAIRATTLVGMNVEDAAGNNVGNADDAFVIVANGEVRYAVISASGLEGLHSDWMLAVPISALTIHNERNTLVVSSQVANLVDAPGFERNAWPDLSVQDWDAGIRSFWADITGTHDPVATPTLVAEEEAVTEPTTTPVAEEEADDADATATPMAEEEAATEPTTTPVAEEEADDATATATPMAEEEAATEPTATPVAEEEVAVEEVDVAETNDELLIRVPYAMSLDALLDFDVHDVTGENLGTVEDFVIDWDTGRIQYAVLSFGGFLGFGERYFAFPWGELVFDPLENAFITNVTEEMLSSAPGFDRDNWPVLGDPTWDNQFYEYWGN